MLVNSVPPDQVRGRLLSLTIVAGYLRAAAIASSSRATRWPESDVSATNARHSRVKSSTTHSTRSRRPSAKRVGYEIQRPALIGGPRQRHRCAHPQRSLTTATAAHL